MAYTFGRNLEDTLHSRCIHTDFACRVFLVQGYGESAYTGSDPLRLCHDRIWVLFTDFSHRFEQGRFHRREGLVCRLH